MRVVHQIEESCLPNPEIMSAKILQRKYFIMCFMLFQCVLSYRHSPPLTFTSIKIIVVSQRLVQCRNLNLLLDSNLRAQTVCLFNSTSPVTELNKQLLNESRPSKLSYQRLKFSQRSTAA